MFKRFLQSAKKDPYVILLHAGTACGLIGFACTDPLHLRIGSNLSEMAAIAFNLTRLPNAIWTPVYWSGAFMAVNSYNIATLLIDRQDITLTPDEEELYIRTFKQSGMRPTQFRRLLEAGTVKRFKTSEVIFQEGSQETSAVYLLTKGNVLIFVQNEYVASVMADDVGAFIGELQLLETFGNHSQLHTAEKKSASGTSGSGNASTGHYAASSLFIKKPSDVLDLPAHRATVTVSRDEEVEAIEWDKNYLLKVLEEQDELAVALRSVLLSTLLKKLRRNSVQDHRQEETYLLHMREALAGGALSEADRGMLRDYALDCGISLKFHYSCLRELGWTEEQFVAGKKNK